MAQNDQPKVIDPDDERYKDSDYFKKGDVQPNDRNFKTYKYTRNTGCGCGPLGCGSGCFTLILLSLFLTYLINLLF
ncbi:hypothetical protein [Staphylococcus casei]|uniref:Uncharacterized protein n=1 Tax=Staphylococcus casei TaxID=201828 RepID=A0ABZ2WCZ7_9STAP|nr:hypothetical protein AST12_03340 [Staphylococcus succinus]PTI41810.1 hypothetical protein BU056_03215 [Staphylococcus succinus]